MASVENDVFQLEQEYTLVTSRLTALETFERAARNMPGIVTPTISYKTFNTTGLRELTIDGTYGTRLRLGEKYLCTYNGARSEIKFLDTLNIMDNNSAPVNMSVPLGAARIVYTVLSTGQVFLASVFLSVNNN
jgi:hypothetical protein